MFKKLWNYINGYVMIEITGFSIERFINLCINKNITMSNLKDTNNGVSFIMCVKDFKILHSISHKTGCKYKVISKYGVPFFIFKNRNRYVFLIGISVFIFLLYFFSSFIWSIKIVGVDNLNTTKLLNVCEQNKLYVGSYKRSINTTELQKTIKNTFDELSWISITVKGTLATIKVSENIKQDEEIISSHSNIISDVDGIITNIATKSGTPKVKVGDVIKKGDILVSGEIYLVEGEEIKGMYTTTSNSDIKAQINRILKVEVPFRYSKKHYTKKEQKRYELLFFNKSLQIPSFNDKINYNTYDTIISRRQLKISPNYPLPFILKTTTYKEYTLVNYKYNESSAKKVANSLILDKINATINFSSDILDNNILYDIQKNKLIATANLTLLQNIGISEPIPMVEKILFNKEGGIENESS